MTLAILISVLFFAVASVVMAVWANDEANDYRYRVERFAMFCFASVAFAALAAMQAEIYYGGGR